MSAASLLANRILPSLMTTSATGSWLPDQRSASKVEFVEEAIGALYLIQVGLFDGSRDDLAAAHLDLKNLEGPDAMSIVRVLENCSKKDPLVYTKKVLLIGSPGVGKTSLVRRFVHGIFSDEHLSTIGVKIDRKDVECEGQAVRMILWDVQGEDEFVRNQESYFRGADGYLLVADLTRHATFEESQALRRKVESVVGPKPFILLLNKQDLIDSSLESDARKGLAADWCVLSTSAKTGQGVEVAFQLLASRMLEAG